MIEPGGVALSLGRDHLIERFNEELERVGLWILLGRHTVPTHDRNRGRWQTSPFWMTIQQADFYCGGTPAVRERKRKGDLTLICQMLSGCSTTAAAYLAQVLPDWDDGANFLSWFMTWQDEYLKEKETTFQEARVAKQTRLGIVPAA